MDNFENLKNQPQEVFVFNIENSKFMLFADSLALRGKYVKPYSHTFYGIIFVSQGEMNVIVEDRSFVLGAGDSVVVPPGKNHNISFDSSDTKAFCINFVFSENFITDGNNLYGKLNQILTDKKFLLKRNDSLFTLLQKCFEAVSSKNKYILSAAFHEYLVSFIISEGAINSGECYSETLSDSMVGRIHRINTLANVYYDKDISVDDIAKMLSLSTKQINRIIKTQFNSTWKELIIEKRMKIARDLLTTTKMSIEEIAEYVGYDSPRGFYLAFSKYFDTTPRTFRSNSE